MSFYTKNFLRIMLILHFYSTLINAVFVRQSQSLRCALKQTECNEKMETLFGNKNVDALDSVRIMIAEWHWTDTILNVDYIKDYYYNFNVLLNAEDIEDPETFCRDRGTECRKYLIRFGNDSLTAARNALYNEKIINTELNSRETFTQHPDLPESSSTGSKNRCTSMQPKICYSVSVRHSDFDENLSHFNKEANDICNAYVLHIKNNIKLLENSKSPMEFCENKFNPTPMEISSGDLFDIDLVD